MATPQEVARTHPEIRYTRLGSVLRELSKEQSAPGAIARVAMESPHDQPFELLPLHLLRDWVQENPEHPLGRQFNWEKLPEKMELDRTLNDHLSEKSGSLSMGPSGSDLLEFVRNLRGEYSRTQKQSATEHHAKADAVRSQHPWATEDDLIESAHRLYARDLRGYASVNSRLIAMGSSGEKPEQIHHRLTSPEHNAFEGPDNPERFAAERPAVAEVHPEIRHTALANVLRSMVQSGGDLGGLAHAALTSPHDQPLDLTPLHALRDWALENPEHPLSRRFNWERLPEKLELDRRVRAAVAGDQSENERSHLYPSIARSLNRDWVPSDHAAEFNKFIRQFPGVPADDLIDSVRRNHIRVLRERSHDLVGWDHRTVSPEFVSQYRDRVSQPDHQYPHLDHTPERFAAHKFSSTQIALTDEVARLIKFLADSIPDADLGEDGRETDPHVTVRFGLHEDSPEGAKKLLAGFGRPVCYRLGPVDTFEGAKSGRDYDVVFASVESPDLRVLNERLAALPHTDTHAFYRPHATIAYTKAGLGRKYADEFNRKFRLGAYSGEADAVVFSDPDRKHTSIPLTAKEPDQFAALRAPAGGAVVQGLFFPGGSVLPKLLPEQPRKFSRREVRQRWKKVRKTLTYPPSIGTFDPGEGGDSGGEGGGGE